MGNEMGLLISPVSSLLGSLLKTTTPGRQPSPRSSPLWVLVTALFPGPFRLGGGINIGEQLSAGC